MHIPMPISNQPDLQLEFRHEVARVLDRINVEISSPAYASNPNHMPTFNVVFNDVPRKERVMSAIMRELDNEYVTSFSYTILVYFTNSSSLEVP